MSWQLKDLAKRALDVVASRTWMGKIFHRHDILNFPLFVPLF
jgi:hypothetical protein